MFNYVVENARGGQDNLELFLWLLRPLRTETERKDRIPHEEFVPSYPVFQITVEI